MKSRIACSVILLCVVLSAVAAAAIAGDDPWERTMTLTTKEMPVRELIEQIFKDSGLNYAIDPEVTGTLPPISFNKVPFRQVLNGIAIAAGLVYRTQDGIVIFSLAPAKETPASRPVNIEAKDVPLSQVIDSLFKDTGLSYTLDPWIGNLKVTAVLKNVPFEVALKQVLQAAGAIYRLEGGTYTISSRVPVGGSAPIVRDMPADAVTEKIPLNFVEPGDVIPAVTQGYNSLPGHPDSLLRVAATGPGFIVLKGTPEAIEQAKKVIRLLDTPDAFPRAVRVSVTAKVTVTRDGKTQTYSATTESAGIEGAPMPLNIDAGREPAMRPPGSKAEISSGRPGAMPANALRLNLTLVPTIVPVAVDAKEGDLARMGVGLSCAGSVGGEVPFHFMKAFEVAASAASGAETTIASGSVDLGEGKVQFSVVATATAEKGRVKRPQGPPPGQGGFGPPGVSGFGGGYGAPGSGQGAVGGFGGAPPAGVQPGAGRPGAATGNRPAAGRPGPPQDPPPGAPQGPPPAGAQPQPAPRQ